MKKRKTITLLSAIASFLMLSTALLNPVIAQEIINPPQEKDPELTQILDSLTNSFKISIKK